MRYPVLLLLALMLPSGCLALQDKPTNDVGEECNTHDWCNEDLKCIFERYNDLSAPGECAPLFACYHDIECPAGALCDGADYDEPGNCVDNTGCQTDAQCGGGLRCFRGSCYDPCTSASECPGIQICTRVNCPPVTPFDECPMGCD